MSTSFTCHRCNEAFALRAGSDERWLTCPRCLASIPNNEAQVIPLKEPLAPVKECPVCGESLRPTWRACPHCGTRCVAAMRPAASLEKDLQRDGQGGTVGLIVLGVIVLVGIVLFVINGGTRLFTTDGGRAVFWFWAITLVFMVAGVVLIIVTARHPDARTAGSAIGGVAIGIGLAMCIVFLIIAAICAGIANFIDTCGGLKPPTQQRR